MKAMRSLAIKVCISRSKNATREAAMDAVSGQAVSPVAPLPYPRTHKTEDLTIPMTPQPEYYHYG